MRRYLGRLFVGLKVNRVIEYLTISDILMLSGWGLINPIIAVFFTEQVTGGTVALAGLASTTYFLVKSFVQIPVARFIDLRRGEWDDYWTMVLGSAIISLSAFLYIFVKTPWQVIAVQVVYGIGGALSYPSWLAIFTRHIDRREEGFEWSLYYTATDLGAALTAGLGGLLAANYGYPLVFMIVGIASLAGTVFLAGVSRNIKKRG
ncbi:hypothetical protein A2Z22_04830 [Candidatus Woesebacteria bacterium RBG_16_34_12]|uniref:Major facilitator superfamily (MFS) profile domain-containing protein n=1 Tax=Candidatus Woesebacteria bacterium RBG_16_34_12 TaxID=1802480 RepID=A0A1F7XC44_9BACT|nr:MAG: hypothetical protein A2Z22_04830 [Candidatus Woesebacteria bacterium RBG_16_34_12]